VPIAKESNQIQSCDSRASKPQTTSPGSLKRSKIPSYQKTIQLELLLQLAAMLEGLEAQMTVRNAAANQSPTRGPPYRSLADREGGLWPRPAKERLRKFPGAIYPRGAAISVRAHHRFHPSSLFRVRREWPSFQSSTGCIHVCALVKTQLIRVSANALAGRTLTSSLTVFVCPACQVLKEILPRLFATSFEVTTQNTRTRRDPLF